MPIRAYFLVITPALVAFLWLASWYMQPEPPKVYTTASTQVKPAAAKSAVATTGAAPTAAEAAPAAPEIKLVASTVEDAKPVQQATKPKKRKHIARRKPRDDQGSAYAYGTPAGGSPYGGQYAGYQPFFGYSRW